MVVPSVHQVLLWFRCQQVSASLPLCQASDPLLTHFKGKYFISDRFNHRIQVFDHNGVYFQSIGSEGTTQGLFRAPTGICLDIDDNLYVADRGKFDHLFFWLFDPKIGNHRIQMFDNEGKFKFSFGSEGKGEGKFSSPDGITLDREGNIVIGDFGNNRIQVRDSNPPPAPPGSFLNSTRTPLSDPSPRFSVRKANLFELLVRKDILVTLLEDFQIQLELKLIIEMAILLFVILETTDVKFLIRRAPISKVLVLKARVPVK